MNVTEPPPELTIKDLAKTDNFRGKVTPRDFIEAVTSSAVSQAKNSTKVFNPSPFIRTFESAIDELLRSKKRIRNKIEDLEDSAKAFETSRGRKMSEMAQTFDEVRGSFKVLEARLAEVGKTAIRIGEQLETVDRQATRAAEAKDLIQYFLEFNGGSVARLTNLKQSGPEGEVKTAVVARRLCAIAKEIDVPGTEVGKDMIEKYCEDLERTFLARFDVAYKKDDRESMRHYACCLHEFNGGNSCMRTYVNQHQFFIAVQSEATDLDGSTMSLAQPLSNAPAETGEVDYNVEMDPELAKLLSETRVTIQDEWVVIFAVFPNYPYLLQQLIQRIFAQSIQIRLENILMEHKDTSPLLYLRHLSLCHGQILRLVKDLHKFDEQVIARDCGHALLHTTLNRSFDDLFVQFVDGERYIDVEKRWLDHMFQQLLQKFNHASSQRLKARRKGNKTASVVSPVGQAIPSLNSPTLSNAPPNDEVQVMTQFFSTMSRIGEDLVQQLPTNVQTLVGMNAEEMGLPSVELTLKFLAVHIEANRRCKELGSASDIPRLAIGLFKKLIECLGTKYLNVALELMLEEISAEEARGGPRAEPNFFHLAVIHVCNQILQLIHIHFQMIIPIVGSSPTIHREMIMFKNEFMMSVEKNINLVLCGQVGFVTKWLSFQLAKQKRLDFKPKDSVVPVAPTPPCLLCVEFIEKVGSEAKKSLDATTLASFLTEVGNGFHLLLMQHFRKFVVSPLGSPLVLCDLTRYQNAVGSFGIQSVKDRFELLKEVTTLFTTKPENLKHAINSGLLGRVEISSLTPYLMMRSDWSYIGKHELFQVRSSASAPLVDV